MAPSSGEWKTALDKFKKRLSKQELQDFQHTTEADVHRELHRLQRDQEQTKGMRNFARFDLFLKFMVQTGNVVEVFLNVSPIVCFVWGPMKLLIQTASVYVDSLDCFISAYEEIGRRLPLLDDFKAFVNMGSDPIRRTYELIYTELLEFHQRARAFCSGPRWTKLFLPMWRNYAPEFKSTLERLSRHKSYIESQAALKHYQDSQQHFDEFKVLRQDIEEIKKRCNDEIEEKREEQRRAVIEWLAAAPNTEIQHDRFQEDRCAATGDWILQHEAIVDWINAQDPECPIVWLTGKPGAGKSILASVIIDSCRNIKPGSPDTSYFYCKEEDPDMNTALAVYKGLIKQMVFQQPHLIPYIYDKRKKSSDITLSSANQAKTLLEDICAEISSSSKHHIIVDGLDECDKVERGEIIKCLVAVVESCATANLRVMIASQDFTDIRKTLTDSKTKPKIISLTVDDNKGDITTFVNQEVKKMALRYELLEDKQDIIRHRLAFKADGMFLYVKLVASNLLAQPTKKLFQDEFESGFPDGLKEAYKRIVSRIKRDKLPQQWETAKKILSWVLASKRPLNWTEMQVAISMDPINQKIEFDAQKLVDNVKDICGSLVYVLGTGRIQLVHNTAKRYLVSEDSLIHLPSVECELAVLCLQYLTFPCFNEETDMESGELRDYAVRGYLAFEDYAVAKWFRHVSAFIHLEEQLQEGWQNRITSLALSLDDFFARYQEENWSEQINQASHKTCEAYQHHPQHESLLAVTSHIYRYQDKGFAARNEVSIKSLAAALKRNRTFLETPPADLTSDEKQKLEEFHGNRRFKCPKINCPYFYEGFTDPKTRKKHLNRHELPFECPDHDCHYAECGFGSNNELQNHVRSYHPELNENAESFSPTVKKHDTKWKCHICSKAFTRNFHMKNHIRSHNGEKPHSCPECGREFTRLNDCKRHQKIHENK